jgi:hypothetical protein
MTVDIRAIVRCSLGELISASVSDDYIQGSGLIKTKGNCEISGLISPAVGSIVTFTYTKSGIVRNVPRKLRVLSSFADPYRRTTKVELGCKLTYLQDLKDPIKWTALNDPENSDLNRNDANIVTLPIFAQSAMTRCLVALGISTSSSPLTNRFSIAEFDFGPGYVQILSDLLVSESYCGYLDFEEKLQVVSLATASGGGPVLDESKIIDVSPIGVGDLPGDAVVVNYSTLKLKAPDDEEVVCRLPDPEKDDEELAELEDRWGDDLATSRSLGNAVYAFKLAEDGDEAPVRTLRYQWPETTTETTVYELYDKFADGSVKPNLNFISRQFPEDSPFYNPKTTVVERLNFVKSRTTTLTTGSAGIAGGIATSRLAAGLNFNNFDVFKTTVETFEYDEKGNEVTRIASTFGSQLFKLGTTSLPTTITNPDGSVSAITIGQATGDLERIEVYSTTADGFTKRVTRRYGVWGETIAGQQAIAEAREFFTTIDQVESYLNAALSGLYLLDVTVETSKTGSRTAQEAPLPEETAAEEFSEDSGDPDNGFQTSSVAEIALATGSSLATRRIELSMPYASDDSFVRRTVSTDPLRYCYFSFSSDAEAKANRYGRAQNRLLFGNRNGMNIQTVPEGLPTEPFGAFYFSANGSVTQYRTNGTSWTMDSNGIVASTDALYWGVAGKTA